MRTRHALRSSEATPLAAAPAFLHTYFLAAIMIGVVILFEYFGIARKLDQSFFDVYVQQNPMPVPENTVIIAVDENSLAALGQWPWRRSVHAELLEYLRPASPVGIVFDILFAEPDKQAPQDDEQLAEAMRAAQNVIIPVHIHPLSNRRGLEEIPPIRVLAEQAAAIGHAHVELDSDGVSRGLYLREGMGKAYWPALSLALLQWHRGQTPSPLEAYVNASETSPYVNVRQDFRLIRFAGGAGSLKTYSYVDVLSGAIPRDAFTGKFVFVGATAAGLGDFLATPVSGQASPMSGVEFHANAFNVLNQHATIQPVPTLWQYLLSVALVLVAVLMIPRIRPERTLPTVLLILFATCLFSAAVLFWLHQWFRPSTAIVAIIIVYPLWTWRRIMQLSHFLSRELVALSQEPHLAKQSMENLKPADLIQHMAFVLQPSGWVLFQDNMVHKAEHYEGQRLNIDLQPGFWVHDGNASWVRFYHGESLWTIGLFWAGDQMRDRKRAYVHRIPFSAFRHRNHKLYAPTQEKLARQIEQVQEAIQNMQHMRRFVSEGFAKMPDGVIVTDPLGGIIFHNPHCQALLEKASEDLTGLPLVDVLKNLPDTGENFWQQVFFEVLFENRQVSIEIQLQHLDILFQFAPFIPAESQESGMIVNLSDITRLKEEQRRKNEAIDFLSHDLRSPLVSQLALLDNIERNQIALTPQLIQQVRAHAQRSMNLAEQFLQVARAEQLQDASFYDCDLINIIYNGVDATLAFAKQKGMTLTFEPEQDDAWTIGNPELLERVIINLLSNAIKYSPEQTEVQITLAQRTEDAQAFWAIAITDQGYGIAPEDIPTLFDSFRRLRRSELEGVHGAGLGLRFVKIVIEKHHGSIHVESIVNRGTTFMVALPISDQDAGVAFDVEP